MEFQKRQKVGWGFRHFDSRDETPLGDGVNPDAASGSGVNTDYESVLVVACNGRFHRYILFLNYKIITL